MSIRKRLRETYLKLHESAPGLHKRLYPLVVFLRSSFIDVMALPRQVLQVDFIRLLVCLPRYVLGFLIFRRYRALSGGHGISENTLAHNLRGSGEISAPRSHLLIRPLISLDRVRLNVRDLKVLSIGPRVEGEIYNLVGYGFSLRNIRGLDLFSYSPFVDVGDMHDMQYPDNSFDVVISGWVLGYSDDKQRCADEMIRVCKNGGFIAVGNGFYTLSDSDVVRQGGLKIGSREKVADLAFIEGLFRPKEGAVFFRYDGARDGVNGAPLILLFEVVK